MWQNLTLCCKGVTIGVFTALCYIYMLAPYKQWRPHFSWICPCEAGVNGEIICLHCHFDRATMCFSMEAEYFRLFRFVFRIAGTFSAAVKLFKMEHKVRVIFLRFASHLCSTKCTLLSVSKSQWLCFLDQLITPVFQSLCDTPQD